MGVEWKAPFTNIFESFLLLFTFYFYSLKMPIILNVDKSGVVSETKILSDKVSELYKKLGYKSADKMEDASTIWPDGVNHIHVYGKTKGRAGSENKYEFPPPIDQTLFFGNVLIVLVSGDSENEKIVDLTLKVWEVVYERLFGGFEDLVDSDGNAISEDESEEDCEDSELEGAEFTKEGYVKDDFIVDDSDDLEEDDDDSELHLPKKKKVAAKKVAVSVVAKKAVVTVVSDSVDVEKKENKKKNSKKMNEKMEEKIVDKVVDEAVKKETKKKVSKKKGTEVATEVSEEAVKKETNTKVGKKSKNVEEVVQEKVEKKVKKESRKKKVLPSLESAVFDDHEEELETLGHISEELAEEEYV